MKKDLESELLFVPQVKIHPWPVVILVSLVEPVGILLRGYSEYHELDKDRIAFYDPTIFINCVLKDIFDDHTLGYENNKVSNSDISHAHNLLMHDGLDEEYAKNLTVQVCQSIIDQIVTFIPSINFGTIGYTFSMVNRYDLFVDVTNAK